MQRERVTSRHSYLIYGILVVLAIALGAFIAYSLQLSASAAPDQVDFNPVTIRNGAKIHVNGDKSLTAIDDGDKLLSDETSPTAVKGNSVQSTLNSYATNNYGSDAITSSFSDTELISRSLLQTFNEYISSVSSPYWLSDTSSKYGYVIRGVAGKDNEELENKTSFTGRSRDGNFFADEEVNLGSADFTQDATLGTFSQPGGTYLYSSTYEDTIYMGQMSWNPKIGNFSCTVYNNPYCIDDPSRGFYSGNSVYGIDHVFGTVKIEGSGIKLERVVPGQRYEKGYILFSTISKRYGVGANEDKFRVGDRGEYMNVYFRASDSGKFGKFSTKYYAGGFAIGFHSYTDFGNNVDGSIIKSGEYLVRPLYRLDSSKVAFVRDFSNNNLSTSAIFESAPTSVAKYGSDFKLVIKTDNTKIHNQINANKLSNEMTLDGHGVISYENNIIKVPYGSSSLKFTADSFSVSNSNYVSALASCNGTKKYTVLAKTGSGLEIDLGTILNTNKVGSSVLVSFYAEQVNDESVSDTISASPVSLHIQVVEGNEQTIKYDVNKGIGTPPVDSKVYSGASFALSDGTALSKDGSLFTCWEINYVPYGETDSVSKMVKAGAPFIVPNTEDCIITAKAIYGGSASKKDTDTRPSMYTVTWNVNAPDGYSVVFTTSGGSYNDDKTLRYDKANLKNSNKVAVADAPTIDTAGKELRVFDGWYTTPSGGNKITTTEIELSGNIVYYAHWTPGYIVTFDTDGGSFTNGETTRKTGNILPGHTFEQDGEWVSDKPSRNDFIFAGWYTEKNGNGNQYTSSTAVNATTTLYAFWLSRTFLGPTTTLANPTEEVGKKYNLTQVQVAARDIYSKGSSSQYYQQYYDYMVNDTYHLYTLRKSGSAFLDPSVSDNWVECRIIQLGQHNGDASGLTFMATHVLPTTHRMTPNIENNGWEWGNLELYSKLSSGGEIYNQFDSSLLSLTRNLPSIFRKKGKLWILSYKEITGTTGIYSEKRDDDGDQYQLFNIKGVQHNNRDNPEARKLVNFTNKRSGDEITDSWYTRTPFVWTTGNNPEYQGRWWNVVLQAAYIEGDAPGNEGRGIVPCFAL